MVRRLRVSSVSLRDALTNAGERLGTLLRPLDRRVPLRTLEPLLFALWAAVCTMANARIFYGYMLKQTGGEWSAPLDDVFIHFDYARATAQGHPFEWTVGNGYSSGNTSLTYPFALAFGWILGFTGRDLMVFAAVLAMTCVFGTLLAARRIFVEGPDDTGGKVGAYLLPPVFLGVGALDWSLWSGMEVAFFLATWALGLVAWLRLEEGASLPPSEASTTRRAWVLGAAGALMVTTRPEAAATLAVFGIAAAMRVFRGRDAKHAALVLVAVGLPGVVCLVLQSIANRALTGEWSANGAIVKLALNNPYMPSNEKLEDWIFNARYAVLRNLDYHFAHIEGEHASELVPPGWSPSNPLVYLAKTAWFAGVVPFALATLPLLFVRTRRMAIVFWAQMVLWVLVVAFNGQVRWQNERYVMPAVAWMLVMVAFGVVAVLREGARAGGARARPNVVAAVIVGALLVQIVGVLTRPVGAPPSFRVSWLLALLGGAVLWAALWARPARAVLVGLSLLFAWDHQIPKMRDQKWFFGRASRNIRDQHLTLGKYLRELAPNRVLVGDAGAILYESDRPGLDVIGLGGYHGLPFARAGVHGLPATIELLERLPPADRPEVLAIFPTWWGVLPLWFGSDVLRRFPVEGNVICGGYEHVVYKADWHLLGTGDGIRRMPPGDTRVAMTVDVADLVSEKAARYAFDRPGNGWTDMRVLPDPGDRKRDLFDGGRRIASGRAERFVLRGVTASKSAHLVTRAAPEARTRVRVRASGRDAGLLELEPTGGWQEPVLALPPEAVQEGAEIELLVEGPADFVDYHLWITQ